MDYYTEFCILLELDDAQRQYAVDIATQIKESFGQEEPCPIESWNESDDDIYEGFMSLKIKDENGYLSIFSDQGEPLSAAHFIQHLFNHFSLQGAQARCAFQWACTSSRPVSNGYGGGACIVTRNEIKIMETSRWVDEQLQLHPV